jgi:cell division protein FtsL
MTGEAFEYAIKKDVRNNPIVREIDRERHRQMWRSSALAVFMVAVLMLVIWRHTDLLHQDVELQQLERALLAQQKQNDQLRLRIERLRAVARIEDEATRRLGMIFPSADEWQPIERAIASPQPPSSVLARR